MNNNRLSTTPTSKYFVMGSKTYKLDNDNSSVYSLRTANNFDDDSIESCSLIDEEVFQSGQSEMTLFPPSMSSFRKHSCPNLDLNKTSSLQPDKTSQSKEFDSNCDVQVSRGPLNGAANKVYSTYSSSPTQEMDKHKTSSKRDFHYLVEAALITSIQSLKLSLEFYRYFIRNAPSDQPETGSQSRFDSATNGGPMQENPTNPLFNMNEQRVKYRNLYMDVLEVESLLYDCMVNFKHTSHWPIFSNKYTNMLNTVIQKVSIPHLTILCWPLCYDRYAKYSLHCMNTIRPSVIWVAFELENNIQVDQLNKLKAFCKNDAISVCVRVQKPKRLYWLKVTQNRHMQGAWLNAITWKRDAYFAV